MLVPSVVKRRILVGALLGLAWYAALLIPAWTRAALTDGDRSPVRMLATMTLVSALSTLLVPPVLFKPRWIWILAAGVLLPIFGSLAFAWSTLAIDLVVTAPQWINGANENPDGRIVGVLGGLIGMFWFGFVLGASSIAAVACWKALFVILPMGLIHVAVVSRVDRSLIAAAERRR